MFVVNFENKILRQFLLILSNKEFFTEKFLIFYLSEANFKLLKKIKNFSNYLNKMMMIKLKKGTSGGISKITLHFIIRNILRSVDFFLS